MLGGHFSCSIFSLIFPPLLPVQSTAVSTSSYVFCTKYVKTKCGMITLDEHSTVRVGPFLIYGTAVYYFKVSNIEDTTPLS